MAALDQGFVDRFRKSWIEAWNHQDVAAIVALCTPQVVWVDPSMGGTVHGRDDLAEGLMAAFRALPDFTVDDYEVYPASEESEMMTRWWVSGTMTGPLEPPGFAPTGQRVEVEGATFLRFEAGQVAEARYLFDMMSMAQQIGAAPAADSGAERVAVFMQRLAARRMRRQKAPAV